MPQCDHAYLFNAHVARLCLRHAAQPRALRLKLAAMKTGRVELSVGEDDRSESMNLPKSVLSSDSIVPSSTSASNLPSKLTCESAAESLTTLFLCVEYSVPFQMSQQNIITTSTSTTATMIEHYSLPKSPVFTTLTHNPPPALLSAARANALFNNCNTVRVSRVAVELARHLPSRPSHSNFLPELKNDSKHRLDTVYKRHILSVHYSFPSTTPSSTELTNQQTMHVSSMLPPLRTILLRVHIPVPCVTNA